MYVQPIGQPMVQATVNGVYPVNAVYPMAPQQFVYAPQMMMAPYPMMAPVQATSAPMYPMMAPTRQQANKGNAVLFVGQLTYDVTFPTTAEADLAIMSLHDRYCMDSRDKPVQVSYCQKTDIISDFGYRHALQLHAENPANPIPSILPTPSVTYAVKFA